MGTRVLIACTDGQSVSTGVFKQYDGDDAPKIIAAAVALARGERMKPDVAIALVTAAAVFDDQGTMGALAAHDGNPAYLVAPLIRSMVLDPDLDAAISSAFRTDISAHSKISARRHLRAVAAEFCLDAGLVVVDVRSSEWTWHAFAGSLEQHEQCGAGAAA